MDDPRSLSPEDFLAIPDSRGRILQILRYGILAPSTHNSQPWLFKVNETEGWCDIYNNREIVIKEADPLGRDLYISFGCLLENCAIAARYYGVLGDIEFIDDKETGRIARILFRDLESMNLDESLRPLLDEIPVRVNVRGLFEDRPITRMAREAFEIIKNGYTPDIVLVEDKEKISALARLTSEGLQAAYHSPVFREEMSRWMHPSSSKKKDGIPGYSLRMPYLVSLIFPFLLRHFDIGRRVGFLNYVSMNSAPMIAVFTARENSPRVWYETGREAQRLMLEARVQGYRTSIFVASVEIGELYKQVQTVLGTGDIPQLVMCIGAMNRRQKPNLRHSVEEKLI